MKVLLIAPLPPPVTGHSLVSQVLLGQLRGSYEVAAVNLSAGSMHDGRVTRRRITEVLKLVGQVWREQRTADVIYLTVSESLAGNFKDLLIYMVCWWRLPRMAVHLHGGSLRKVLFDHMPVIETINRTFISRLGAVIISGRAHVRIFDKMIEPRRVHIVPNFAQDALFLTDQQTVGKFAAAEPLRVLYLSAMSEAKGYKCLVDAYTALGPDEQCRLALDFAGRFESPDDEAQFRRQIAAYPGMRYHGFVDDERKQSLLAGSHVFCLPTMLFEGQPISILEAYASGCVVLTTGQEGIRDIFDDNVHGFEFEAGSPRALGVVLKRLIAEPQNLLSIARRNRNMAESRYRTASYTEALKRIFQCLAAPQ
jgi:glycosyltransferase involved in cell wall biosynthesis